MLCGFILEKWLSLIHNDYVLEINLTVIGSFLIFYVAETFKLSGILTLVALGLYMSMSGKTGISAHSLHALHYIWGYIGFLAETLIFMFAGVIMGGIIKEDEKANLLYTADIGYIIVAYFILLIIRFICIIIFFPCLKRMGYGLDFK